MSPIYLDYSNTHILLAGGSEYYEEPSLLPLQNVKSSVQQFHRTFLDTHFLGIPNENIVISLNESRKQLNRKIKHLAEHTSKQANTLIFYFSGYGVLSQENNKFYLVASDTNLRYLEDEGVSLQSIKEKLSSSKAGKKILIIDALFRSVSGNNAIQTNAFSEFEYFDDVFVLTNSVDNANSFHDYFNPERPTFLTEKIMQAVQTGLSNENPFLSTNELAALVDNLYQSESLSPLPKSYGNSASRDILFCKNVKFDSDIEHSDSEEDKVWLRAQDENSAFVYDDYIDKYPNGKYVALAIENLKRIEEDDQSWLKARRKNLLFSYREYLYNFPSGVHSEEALKRIKEIKLNGRKAKFQQELVSALNETKEEILTGGASDEIKKVKSSKQKKDFDLIDSFIRNETKIIPSTQFNISNEDLSREATEQNNDIITEQFAKLLVKQKNYKKATEAYETLSKKFPEKVKIYNKAIADIKSELR